MECKTKIIIVDDHSMFREGMKLLIEMEGLGKVIAEAENGKEFLDLLEVQNPDLVLMDIEMPVMSGVEATQKAKTLRPELKILALSMLGGKDNYSAMIKAGVMGFVLKTSGKKELEKAINTVIGGDCYFSNELMRQIIVNSEKQPISDNSEIKDKKFTDRELEILQYLCNGLTVNEIADKLFRSIKTIEANRSTLLEKTDSKNTINLVLYAIRNKLVNIS
jgi:DNA-binding NarL/FixJ family response regulator